MTRPLSTYDNLNTNDTKITTQSTPDTNGTHDDGNQTHPNVTNSPFNGITFRFDEMKQPQYDGGRTMTTTTNNTTATTNGYDNISNSEYEHHRNNNNNNSNNSNNNSNGMNMGRGNQVTTIAQNHLLETVDAVLKPNRSIMKPVHSEAKSQFLGLNMTNGGSSGGGGGTAINGRNGDCVDGAIDQTNEDEPLLTKLNGNRSISMTPHRQHAAVAQTQYQNVPNNSACYGQNQIIDANDTCTCKTLPDNGIRSMNSDRYECDRCNESNNNMKRMEANAIPTTSADANAANSTITHMASSSYLMSESLSQVIGHDYNSGCEHNICFASN